MIITHFWPLSVVDSAVEALDLPDTSVIVKICVGVVVILEPATDPANSVHIAMMMSNRDHQVQFHHSHCVIQRLEI